MARQTVIGVLGGMGPAATASFFQNIIQQTTDIHCDQDHFRVVIDSHPQIPDRTEAILHKGPSPLDALMESVQLLERAGCDLIAIPCMTGHYYIDTLQAQSSVKILNAYQVLNRFLENKYPSMEKVGVMCTDGTRKIDLFSHHLSKQVIYPNRDYQEKVMKAIYGPEGIKNGHVGTYPNQLLKEAGHHLIDEGAQAIIAGCTEIELATGQADYSVEFIDPMKLLVDYIVKNYQ